jgi:hypothetical protein
MIESARKSMGEFLILARSACTLAGPVRSVVAPAVFAAGGVVQAGKNTGDNIAGLTALPCNQFVTRAIFW